MEIERKTDLPDVKTHVETAPEIFTIFWAVGGAFVGISLVITIVSMSMLYQKALSLRDQAGAVFMNQQAEIRIHYSWLFIIFAGTNYLALFSPRQTDLLFCVFIIFLATDIAKLWKMVITEAGGPEVILKANAEIPPRRPFCIAPCCCLGLIGGFRHLSKTDFRIMRSLIHQYVWIGPVVAVLGAFGSTRGPIDLLANYVVSLSRVLCMFGLKALQGAALPILNTFLERASLKFTVMQLIVILPAIVDMICGIPGVANGINETYDDEMMRVAARNFGCCLLSPFLAGLAAVSSPPSEIETLHNSDKKVEKVGTSRGAGGVEGENVQIQHHEAKVKPEVVGRTSSNLDDV